MGSDHLGYPFVIVVTVVIDAFCQGFRDGWQVVITEWVIAAAHKKKWYVGKPVGNTSFGIGIPAQVAIET